MFQPLSAECWVHAGRFCWLCFVVPQWMRLWVSEWVSEWVCERERERQRVSEWISEWVSEWVSEWMSEWVSAWALSLVIGTSTFGYTTDVQRRTDPGNVGLWSHARQRAISNTTSHDFIKFLMFLYQKWILERCSIESWDTKQTLSTRYILAVCKKHWHKESRIVNAAYEPFNRGHKSGKQLFRLARVCVCVSVCACVSMWVVGAGGIGWGNWLLLPHTKYRF